MIRPVPSPPSWNSCLHSVLPNPTLSPHSSVLCILLLPNKVIFTELPAASELPNLVTTVQTVTCVIGPALTPSSSLWPPQCTSSWPYSYRSDRSTSLSFVGVTRLSLK